MDGLSVDSCSNVFGTTADHQPSKLIHERTMDELTDDTVKTCRMDSTYLSGIYTPSVSSVVKEKPLKKVRRPPNAFMLFAKEQRPKIDPSVKKDKKSHVNSILGGMWRELSASEKAKYYLKSRHLRDAYKKTEANSAAKNFKKKVHLKKIPKKSVGRPIKKKKVLKRSTSLESDVKGKTEIESDSKKPVDKVENTGENTCPPSEPPRVSVEYSSSSCIHQRSIAKSHFHRMTPSAESHPPKPCCCQAALPPNYSNDDNLNRYSAFGSGVSSSCSSTGLVPPMFPSTPFYSPFWMYQQSMAHHMFPFPSQGFFPPFTFGCSSPFSYTGAYNNAYFNSYSSLYSGRCAGPFSYSSHPSVSSTAVRASNEGDSTEGTENSEICEDELLVVDGGDPNGSLNRDNKTT